MTEGSRQPRLASLLAWGVIAICMAQFFVPQGVGNPTTGDPNTEDPTLDRHASAQLELAGRLTTITGTDEFLPPDIESFAVGPYSRRRAAILMVSDLSLPWLEDLGVYTEEEVIWDSTWSGDFDEEESEFVATDDPQHDESLEELVEELADITETLVEAENTTGQAQLETGGARPETDEAHFPTNHAGPIDIGDWQEPDDQTRALALLARSIADAEAEGSHPNTSGLWTDHLLYDVLTGEIPLDADSATRLREELPWFGAVFGHHMGDPQSSEHLEQASMLSFGLMVSVVVGLSVLVIPTFLYGLFRLPFVKVTKAAPNCSRPSMPSSARWSYVSTAGPSPTTSPSWTSWSTPLPAPRTRAKVRSIRWW